MAENVTYFGELADKFDALVAYDEKLLDNYVEGEGYSLSSMVFASTAMAFMTFAKGFVDVGRLGNGILIEGGWKGAGKDVLRALNFAGGAGAIISRGSKMLRLVQVGESCVPIAYTNALRLTGQRFLITLEDLISKAGLSMHFAVKVGTSLKSEMQIITTLRALGIPVKILKEITSKAGRMNFQELIKLVRSNPGGVVTFGVNGPKGAHQLYATFTRLGGVVIRDPSFKFKVYRSVADLEKAFTSTGYVTEGLIAFIPNALLTAAASVAETVGGLAGLPLAFQVIPVVTIPAGDAETAIQSLMIQDKLEGGAGGQNGGTIPSITGNYKGVPGKYHTVVRGDWLSKIAKHYYGNLKKWPVIYAANRKIIGRNPDLIVPNQKLFIPDLPLARIIAANSLPGGMSVPA